MSARPGRRASSRPPMPIPRGWRIPAEQLCADVEVKQPPTLDDESGLTSGGRGRNLAVGLLGVVLVAGLAWFLRGASRPPDEGAASPQEAPAPGARDGPNDDDRADDVAPRDPSPSPVDVDAGEEDRSSLPQ